jgi:DNA modification methylase
MISTKSDILTPHKIYDMPSDDTNRELSRLYDIDSELNNRFKKLLKIDINLTRKLVSFQDNKQRPIFRWYKFKEAFSAALVEYLLEKYKIDSGKLLDPFAGSGTALFAASMRGLDTEGIELLPIGHQIITTKICLERKFTKKDHDSLLDWIKNKPWNKTRNRKKFSILKITDGAYPTETLNSIEHYLGALSKENQRVQFVLKFALLCVLESISYTRKDGQYLRWDKRSGRRQGIKAFDKGKIPSFDEAVITKLNEIVTDIRPNKITTSLCSPNEKSGDISLHEGSCLEILPTFKEGSFSAILTSPPYCNRYDYTRTYALELALLGTDEKHLRDLRQNMISCTVENRAKDLLSINPQWQSAIDATDNQGILQEILKYLEDLRANKQLNNTGIPRMVRGYFYEMACVISECYRVLKPGGYMFMVNDNVRYAGANVSVDLILSDIGEKLGFKIERILVLPIGKGNSSQQMGTHGRTSLRKCVYVWKKE